MRNSNINTQASLLTRFNVWITSIPWTTRIVLIVCSTIHLSGYLFGTYTSSVCTQPTIILAFQQIYRLVASAWFHSGILHIVFNMMAFIPMGSSLERMKGTLPFLWMILLFNVLCAITHVVLAVFLDRLAIYSGFMNECTVGFSGIIFALLVVTLPNDSSTERSIFGIIRVPVQWYPWVLLIVLQIVVSSVSFLGHLSGILVGYAYVYGLLNFLTPIKILGVIERSVLLAPIVKLDGFITQSNVLESESLWSNLFGSFRSPTLPSTTSPPAWQAFSGPGRVLGSGTVVRQDA
mmetsp:Transcript_27903/g.39315  ORF Transcript_27903/g.39315 Transcript_27903/m.39315 type:complete len:292 (-) Transcript_27903:5027-5902(-)